MAKVTVSGEHLPGADEDVVYEQPELPFDEPEADAEPDAPSGRSNGEIRAWARSRGIEISDKGPIPSAVLAAYEAVTGE